MGEVAGFRRAWIDAAEYSRKVDIYEKKRARGEGGEAPKRDLGLETLAGVLKGDILVQNHCYRADEMAVMLDVGHEFGYKTRAFHHAVERSEEQTSELQSLMRTSYAVFCLKKTN